MHAFIYIYIYLHAYAYIHLYLYIYICTCIFRFTYLWHCDMGWILNVISTDVHWMEYCLFSDLEMRSSIGTSQYRVSKTFSGRMRPTSPTSPVTSRTWRPTQMMRPLWFLANCRLCRMWRSPARMAMMAPASVSAGSELNQKTLEIQFAQGSWFKDIQTV